MQDKDSHSNGASRTLDNTNPNNNNKLVESNMHKQQQQQQTCVALELGSSSAQRRQQQPLSNAWIKQNSNDAKYLIAEASIKRYFILVMYAICSMQKSFQWINLSTITNKVSYYYEVDNMAVNWTSVLFMITFIPLVLPTGYMIERIGLRRAVLIGSFGIALGACVKCFACEQDRFYVIICGQIIVSLSEQFIFCIPAKIASVWFPDNQVSFATGFGIFGNQVGIALGFIVPQALLSGRETRQAIGDGLRQLFYGTAGCGCVTLFVLLLLFDDAPKYAPGNARLRILQDRREFVLSKQAQHNGKSSGLAAAAAAAAAHVTHHSSPAPHAEYTLTLGAELKIFARNLWTLLKDTDCVLLILAYGINVGVGYAIQTLLNQMITGARDAAWREPDKLVATSGMIVIVCGMCGALWWGWLCDASRRYVLITRVLYLGALVCVASFGLTLQWHNEIALYCACALTGFTLIGYTVAGLDTIVEISYPAPELVSTSIMSLSPQIFGTGITFACSAIVDSRGALWGAAALFGCLLVGLLATLCMGENLRRQKAALEIAKQRQNLQLQ